MTIKNLIVKGKNCFTVYLLTKVFFIKKFTKINVDTNFELIQFHLCFNFL